MFQSIFMYISVFPPVFLVGIRLALLKKLIVFLILVLMSDLIIKWQLKKMYWEASK